MEKILDTENLVWEIRIPIFLFPILKSNLVV